MTKEICIVRNLKVVFTEPGKVEVHEEDMSPDSLGGDEILVRSLYTAVSPGTELACLAGREASWFAMPGVPGYSGVGVVEAVGGAVNGYAEGDTVVNYGGHQKYKRFRSDDILFPAPECVEPKLLAFTRLATVAFTAVRVSNIELGDDVAVVGLGVVGNIAAQLARLQGGRVVGVDLSARRAEIARECGVERAVCARSEEAGALIEELTAGAGVSTLIDATGSPRAILDSLSWIGRMGELILLGSPRDDFEANVTEVLRRVHLYGLGSVTLKGAHEHQYPKVHDPFVKHSFERNSRIVWRLLDEGKLRLAELITHVVKPADAASAYEGLRDNPNAYLGVVFDWTD